MPGLNQPVVPFVSLENESLGVVLFESFEIVEVILVVFLKQKKKVTQ